MFLLEVNNYTPRLTIINDDPTNTEGKFTISNAELSFFAADHVFSESEDLDAFTSEFYIASVEVDINHRRLGKASSLINHAVEYAKASGYAVATLRKDYGMGGDGKTDSHLDALYTRLGFIHITNNTDAMYKPL